MPLPGFNALAVPPSPLQAYRAQVQQDFITKPPRPPEPGIPSPTPEHSRGSYAMVAQEDLRIEVELGPLLVHHRFRGPSPALQVSVWA